MYLYPSFKASYKKKIEINTIDDTFNEEDTNGTCFFIYLVYNGDCLLVVVMFPEIALFANERRKKHMPPSQWAKSGLRTGRTNPGPLLYEM